MNHQAENPALQVFDSGSQKETTDDSIPAKNTKQHYDETKQSRTKSPETLMNEKQIESHHNRDTNTVFHQQHYKDRNLVSPKSNAKMITVPTSAIDAKRGETNDTARDTTLEDNHHSDKTRKPRINNNQATMMTAPSYKQKENKCTLVKHVIYTVLLHFQFCCNFRNFSPKS